MNIYILGTLFVSNSTYFFREYLRVLHYASISGWSTNRLKPLSYAYTTRRNSSYTLEITYYLYKWYHGKVELTNQYQWVGKLAK